MLSVYGVNSQIICYPCILCKLRLSLKMGTTIQAIDNTSFLASMVFRMEAWVPLVGSWGWVRSCFQHFRGQNQHHQWLKTLSLICRALLCTVLEKVVLNLLPEVFSFHKFPYLVHRIFYIHPLEQDLPI